MWNGNRFRLLFGAACLLVITAAVQAQGPTLAGRVVEDSSGEPVASAELRIRKAGLRELVADLETDGSGLIPGVRVPDGDYTAEVSRPNFITASFSLHIPDTSLQLRLLRYAVMDGKVLNSNGQPLPGEINRSFPFPGGSVGSDVGGTQVSVLTREPGSDEFRPFRHTTVQKDGSYHLQELPPGEYELRLSYFGLNEGAGVQLYPDSAHPRLFEIAGGEAYTDLIFLVPPNQPYKVSGKVELPTPDSRFALSLATPDQPGIAVGHAFTADGGGFQFDQVPAGAYDVYASLFGRGDPLYGRERIQVGGADLTGVVVPVRPGKSLSIALRPHQGETLPSACPQTAKVSVASLDPWLFGDVAYTAEASFAKPQILPNLPPGRFSVTVADLGDGCFAITRPQLDLSQDVAQPVVVEVAAAGSVRGTLHASGDFVVILLNAENTDGAASRLAWPDAEGNFAFTGLRPGQYRLAGQPAGAASNARWVQDLAKMMEITVTGGAETNVELSAGGLK